MRGRAARGVLAIVAALAVAIGLAAVVAEGAGAAGPAPGARVVAAKPPSSLTWHAPVSVTGAGIGPGSVVAVSCPAPSYCAAFDFDGYQATWHGSGWTAPVKIAAYAVGSYIDGATCAAPGFCLALGTAIWIHAGAAVRRYEPGGSGHEWIRVSCASPALCVAGDYRGDVTLFNGHSWSKPVRAAPSGFGGLSCVSAVYCVALDFNGSVVTWNGTAWKITDADLMPNGFVGGVSCASATFCMAMNARGGVYTFNGSAWAGPEATGLGESEANVSCTSPTFCVAVAVTTKKAALYNGSTWSLWPQPVVSGSLNALVSCAPGSRDCAAADTAGYAAMLQSGTWTGQVAVDVPAELDTVACPSTEFCAAAGAVGDVVIYRVGRWGALSSLLPGGSFSSVSCPSARFCLVAGTTGSGTLRMWRYNGTRWTRSGSPAAPSLQGVPAGSVSCVSAAFCVWVAQADGLISVFNGTTWTKPTSLDKAAEWTDVSCATRSFCAATDTSGNVATYNGKAWSKLRKLSTLASAFSLSCPSPSFCAAGQMAGVTTFNGRTWTRAPTSDDPGLFAVSCTLGNFCAGIGAFKSALTGAFTLNGRYWSSPVRLVLGDTNGAISCATPAFCVAANGDLVRTGTRK